MLVILLMSFFRMLNALAPPTWAGEENRMIRITSVRIIMSVIRFLFRTKVALSRFSPKLEADGKKRGKCSHNCKATNKD